MPCPCGQQGCTAAPDAKIKTVKIGRSSVQEETEQGLQIGGEETRRNACGTGSLLPCPTPRSVRDTTRKFRASGAMPDSWRSGATELNRQQLVAMRPADFGRQCDGCAAVIPAGSQRQAAATTGLWLHTPVGNGAPATRASKSQYAASRFAIAAKSNTFARPQTGRSCTRVSRPLRRRRSE